MRDNALQQRVSRLRELIKDAATETAAHVDQARMPPMPDPTDLEADAWRRYNAFVQNEPLPAADTSARARAIRNINRIAVGYQWVSELQRILDRYGESSLQALSDSDLEVMHDRFVTLESCYLEGCDLPDAPHAR